MLVKRIVAIILVAVYLLMAATVLTACGIRFSGDKDTGGSDGGEPSEFSDESDEPQNTGEPDEGLVDIDDGQQDDPQKTDGEPSRDMFAGAMPDFTDEGIREYVNIEWKPANIEKSVAPYTVKDGLSNVENLDQFGSFTPKQMQMLTDNGFVVTPSYEEQLFYVYETNEYLKIPSFITTDSVLQAYHVFFDYSLRTLEYEYLIEDLEQLTDSMLRKSIYQYENIQNPDVRAAALKNTSYFAAAQLALEKELPEGMPNEALDLAKAEFKLISEARGFEASPIFGYKLDYSQYKPRGHYTRNHDFERFFKAMMWYGQVPFPLLKETEERIELFVPETLQAMLITCGLFTNVNEESDIVLWENIYGPTVFYVGSADDLTIYHYKDMLIRVFGESPNPETFTDSDKLELLLAEAKELPQPKIQAEWIEELWGVDTPVGSQFRFMGQRYIPDSEILQRLTEPIIRPFPKGLDVMGVLGSDRAYDILTDVYDEDGNWDKYPEEFSKAREEFADLPEETWRSNMYYGWLWVLKAFTEPFGDGYPSFMTNRAWQDKSLSTALASWSELRHDTILYGKQSGAECGGGEIPPIVKGYVEPNIQVYERLLWLTKYSRENLEARDILPNELGNRMEKFEKLLQFLIGCSVKELKNEELTQDEYDRILHYGGELESLTSSFAENGMRWFEITSETDKNMAVIADVHTASPGLYLEEGVGPASHIFVVVQIGGKLYLTRGAVFSYYEFVSENRLTDEEWQKMLIENKQPPLPEWVDTFTDRDSVKEEIPIPDAPYDSGC